MNIHIKYLFSVVDIIKFLDLSLCWRKIGMLHLSRFQFSTTNIKRRFEQMLEKWFEMDTTALLTALESPAVSYSAPDKGD